MSRIKQLEQDQQLKWACRKSPFLNWMVNGPRTVPHWDEDAEHAKTSEGVELWDVVVDDEAVETFEGRSAADKYLAENFT